MGRVYNALLKADKLGNTNRPIGRPAGQDAEARRHGNAAIAERPAAQEFVRRADETIEEAYMRQCAERAAQFDQDGAEAAPAFEFGNFFSVREAMTGQPVVEPVPAPSPVAARGTHTSASRHRVAASQPAAPAKPKFEEPREIADLKSLKIDDHLAALAGDDRLAAERYRTLAVRLANLATRRKLKTIVVTSAVAGEGKTTVAINLAWVFAQRDGRRVLLIDANLSHPSVARALSVAPTHGWLDVANEKSSLIDSIVRIDPNGLYVAPPRSMASDETDGAMASSHLEKLAALVEDQFDLIVIDAAPLLESADAQQLASIADGTVIVARAGHTHHASVSDAINFIPEDRRLGLVLNESEIDAGMAKSNRSRLFGRKNRK
jgi:capsular exopolysaccharide synthesis family protein